MIKRIPYALFQWAVCGTIYFALILLGLPAVALGLAGDGQYRTPKIWRLWGEVDDVPIEWSTSRWKKWWWMAIRNPVLGLDMYLPYAPQVTQYGEIREGEPGLQWRYRHTKWRDSFRLAWGAPDPKDGKKEFYIGFKIGPDVDNTSFTVQFRPF